MAWQLGSLAEGATRHTFKEVPLSVTGVSGPGLYPVASGLVSQSGKDNKLIQDWSKRARNLEGLDDGITEVVQAGR